MTLVSDIFNKLVDITEETLPSYTHLPDGLNIEKNSDLDLKYGFSVNIGPASPGPEQYGCQVQLFEREYLIALTNVYTVRTNTKSRNDYELALMEDLYKLTKEIISKPSLDGIVAGVSYSSDIGPQYLDDDRQEYLYTDVTFSVSYEEILK